MILIGGKSTHGRWSSLYTDDDSIFFSSLPSPSYLDKTRTDDDVFPIGRPPFYGLPHSLSTPTRSLITVTLCDGARRREGEANMFLLAANHAALRWISPQRHLGELRHGCPGFRRAVALPSVSGAAPPPSTMTRGNQPTIRRVSAHAAETSISLERAKWEEGHSPAEVRVREGYFW